MARYLVLSPDDVPSRTRPFGSREAAERAVLEFAARYVVQGYYAAVDGVVALEDIPARCRIVGHEKRHPARSAG